MDEFELTIEESMLYEAFLKLSDSLKSRSLDESLLPEGIADIVSFAKEVGAMLKGAFENVLEFLKDKVVFKIFAAIKWSFARLKEAFEFAKTWYQKITKFVPNLVTELAKQGIKLAKNIKINPETIEKVRAFIEKYKTLFKVASIAGGILLVFMWFQTTFTGDLDTDFDVSHIVDVFTGRTDFFSYITSDSGLSSLLMFFITMLTGVSLLSWFSTPVNILIAIAKTFKKKLKT